MSTAVENPLLEGLQLRRRPEPCVAVIYGASGDLAQRKLMPALYALAVRRLLPERFAIVGAARSDETDDAFRDRGQRNIQIAPFAQHRIRDLFDQLVKRGVDVRFAIHPVAGRMPGHMNVLLAEADIPYDRLIEVEDANADMEQTDVVLVVGANDIVNPAARSDKGSPIFGMPIIDADKARTVFAIKRSMNPGFAGIENELYFRDNCLMLFGDAKAVVGDLVKEFTGEGGGH